MIETSFQPNLPSTMLHDRSYAGLVGAPGCIIASVEGKHANVGKTVPLPSGATIKMKADGAWVYNVAEIVPMTDHHDLGVDAVRYEIVEGTALKSGVLSVCIDRLGQPRILTEESQASADQQDLQPLRILVHSPTRTSVKIDLRKACEHVNESSATVILRDSEVGRSQVNSEGILTFAPEPSFTGNTLVKCLVEQLNGAARVVEILLSITPPVQFSDTVSCYSVLH